MNPDMVPHHVAAAMLAAGMLIGWAMAWAVARIERQERARRERQRSAELGPCSRRFYDWERDGI